jgi:arylsulfatase
MMGYKPPNIEQDRLRGKASARHGCLAGAFRDLALAQNLQLRSDPFEQADKHTLGYDRWMAEHFFLMVPAQQYVGQFLGTFQGISAASESGSFGIDQVLESLTRGAGDK